jgi:hypothetical protein
VSFAFQHTGRTPVRITELVSGCGCASVSASATILEPGTAGTVSVIVEIPERGERLIPIRVLTDEPKAYDLDIIVQVPSSFYVITEPRQIVLDAAGTRLRGEARVIAFVPAVSQIPPTLEVKSPLDDVKIAVADAPRVVHFLESTRYVWSVTLQASPVDSRDMIRLAVAVSAGTDVGKDWASTKSIDVIRTPAWVPHVSPTIVWRPSVDGMTNVRIRSDDDRNVEIRSIQVRPPNAGVSASVAGPGEIRVAWTAAAEGKLSPYALEAVVARDGAEQRVRVPIVSEPEAK